MSMFLYSACERRAVEKQLECLLAKKWHQKYSDEIEFVR